MKSRRITKKGASEAVMFVLLVGFVVALGSMVFFYQKSFISDNVEGSVRFGESRLECDDVFLNVDHRDEVSSSNNCWVHVTNTGSRSISGVVLRGDIGSGPMVLNGSSFMLKPGEGFVDKSLLFSGETTTLEVIPLVTLDGTTYACESKIEKVSCAPSFSCGNSTCDMNEGCETIGVSVMCDAKKSSLPSGYSCVNCKLLTDNPL